ncbi:unnamed protein product, partial [Dicrocoelium dendriticum]
MKALLFLSSLTSPADSDNRIKLRSKLDTSCDTALHDLNTKYLRGMNLKRASQMLQSNNSYSDMTSVDKIAKSNVEQNRFPEQRSWFQRPPTPRWNCAAWRLARICEFRFYKRQDCGTLGPRERWRVRVFTQYQSTLFRRQSHLVSTTCSSRGRQGQKFSTLLINNLQVSLQIDTASDITIISYSTWKSMGKPKCCSERFWQATGLCVTAKL